MQRVANSIRGSTAARPKPICYSPSLRYVFIHIPKCAGTTIHRALHALHNSQSLVPPERQSYHKHAKAVDVRKVLGRAWDQSFKFAFVRNPWDLMVSSYHWWLSYAEEFSALEKDIDRIREMGNFANFIRSEYGRHMINEHRGDDLLEWLSDDGGVIVDFIGRYENLEQDWTTICQKLEVQPVPLGWDNQTRRAHYQSFYDTESRQLVAERFAQSIRHFGYQF